MRDRPEEVLFFGGIVVFVIFEMGTKWNPELRFSVP